MSYLFTVKAIDTNGVESQRKTTVFTHNPREIARIWFSQNIKGWEITEISFTPNTGAQQ